MNTEAKGEGDIYSVVNNDANAMSFRYLSGLLSGSIKITWCGVLIPQLNNAGTAGDQTPDLFCM